MKGRREGLNPLLNRTNNCVVVTQILIDPLDQVATGYYSVDEREVILNLIDIRHAKTNNRR